MFLFGIVTGWTNENLSVGLIVILMCYIIYYKIESIEWRLWNFSGLLGSIMGFVIMLLSLGINRRLNNAGGSGNILQWIKRSIFYSVDLLNYFYIPIMIFVLLMTYFIIKKKVLFKKSSFKNIIYIFIHELDVTFIYFIGFFASVYSMIVSPEFPDRAWTFPFLFLLITLGNLYQSLNIRINLNYKNVIVALLVAVSLSSYFDAYFDLKNVYISYQERENIIHREEKNGNTYVEIPNIQGWTKYSCYDEKGDLNNDYKKWPNTAIAKYYGVDEIKIKK